jgi:hypothetical protein
MAKVILMTTREVNNLINKIKSKYEIKEVQYPQNLVQQFISGILLYELFSDEIDKNKNLGNDSPLKKLYFSDIDGNDKNITKYGLLKGNTKVLKIKDDDKIVFIDFIADQIAKKCSEYKENKVNMHNSHMHFGKLSYLQREDNYIFFANEYPVAICAKTEAKRRYFTALFAEIETIVGEEKLGNIDEFVVISHDKDWFKEGKTASYYSNQQLNKKIRDNLSDYPSLNKQLNNSKFHLLAFVHEMNSNVYKYVINNFGDEIINEMLNKSIIDFCINKAIERAN